SVTFQSMGSIRRTIDPNATMPIAANAAAITKAPVKLPVWSTTTPVMRGAVIPAMLAQVFCTPIHLADAVGPPSVWTQLYTPAAFTPGEPAPAGISQKCSTGPCKAARAEPQRQASKARQQSRLAHGVDARTAREPTVREPACENAGYCRQSIDGRTDRRH